MDHGTLTAQILSLAADHGLQLDASRLRVIEMGLDFRVVLAPDSSGADWVLRIPRQPAVMERAAPEARVLRLVARHLSPAVPDWQIHTEELIAYPLLPGHPALELDQAGSPIWHVDISSPGYTDSLGDLLAQLHAIPREAAAETGVPIRTAEESRTAWRADIARVVGEFTVADHLVDRWRAWLDEDSYWPEHTVLTHGEVYPGHTLVAGGEITAVLDWTTAGISDPARDLMFHRATASPAAFDRLLRRYESGGGRLWPRVTEHCAEMFAANPVGYGIYALETGEESHLTAAAQQLNPAG